jgi:glucoamylase
MAQRDHPGMTTGCAAGFRPERLNLTVPFWWLHAPIHGMLAGQRLAIALPRPGVVHWGREGWRETVDEPTSDSGLGFQVAALDVGRLLPGEHVDFTWRWQETSAWQGRDYRVTILAAEVA